MKATLKSYVIGFILSIVLTIAAAGLIWIHINSGHRVFTHEFLTLAILGLALAQLIVQLIFFMHLGQETGPRWKTAVLISTIGIILIVVTGGIWIMNHLNYAMMASPSEMNTYIQSQDGF